MQPLFIGPYDLGVKQNMTPFMIMDKAFPNMLNAFVWRGRVERKAGYKLLGRLRRNVTTESIGTISAAGAGTFTFTPFGTTAQVILGSITPITIVVGAQTLTENTGSGTFVVAGAGVITAATINYATGVLSITFSGALAPTAATFTGAYFPGLPVMGIRTREVPSQANFEQTIFFDTKYAYSFSTQFDELASTLPTTWSGTDYQQFWTTNFQNDSLNAELFWATNNVSGLHQYAVTVFAAAAAGPPSTVQVTAAGNTFQLGDIVFFDNLIVGGTTPGANNAKFGVVTIAGNPTFTISNPATNYFTNEVVTGMALSPNRNVSGDGIRFYNGTTWANYNPIVSIPVTLNNVLIPGEVLTGGLIIVPYKGRLVVLNTIEGNSTTNPPIRYPQRARWSQLCSITQSDIILDFANAWRDDIAGRGGFEDAATEEEIISCGFVKDELIVYFERSTWKLVYTSNESRPFLWLRISSELGAESTFSAVQFDDGLVALGNVGVHASNGSQVQRIDQDIPDEVFKMHNNVDGPLRTSGIRDFFQEIVYFAYTDGRDNTMGVTGPPTKTFFPDKMMIYNYRNNTFSFFSDQATTFGYFQRVTDLPWSALVNPFTWAGWGSPWNSGVLKAQFPSVAFGNHQGFVEVIVPIISSNDRSLMIQNMVAASPITTITSPQHGLFEGDYVTIKDALGSTNLNDITFQVVSVINADSFTIDGVATGAYTSNGTLVVQSQVSIQTKQFTPFWERGNRYDLKYMDILFDRTSQGEIGVNIFVDFTDVDSMTPTASGTVLGNPIVSTAAEGANLPYYQFQQQGPQIWKRFYTLATGETFQFVFSFTDSEMRSRAINDSDIVIHGMIFHFEESGAFY